MPSVGLTFDDLTLVLLSRWKQTHTRSLGDMDFPLYVREIGRNKAKAAEVLIQGLLRNGLQVFYKAGVHEKY